MKHQTRAILNAVYGMAIGVVSIASLFLIEQVKHRQVVALLVFLALAIRWGWKFYGVIANRIPGREDSAK
jgi:steroid 5-alpha reductase family enzyme